MMPEVMQRRLVMLMCFRCMAEKLDSAQLAFNLRILPSELAETKALFLGHGFIDEDWNLLNWNKRQFLSDSSVERVRKHRRAMKQLHDRYGNDGHTDLSEQIPKQRQKEIAAGARKAAIALAKETAAKARALACL
jgi:hypothetical protein